jgi:hypothetical protein
MISAENVLSLVIMQSFVLMGGNFCIQFASVIAANVSVGADIMHYASIAEFA